MGECPLSYPVVKTIYPIVHDDDQAWVNALPFKALPFFLVFWRIRYNEVSDPEVHVGSADRMKPLHRTGWAAGVTKSEREL
jgi:hypothetical protein